MGCSERARGRHFPHVPRTRRPAVDCSRAPRARPAEPRRDPRRTATVIPPSTTIAARRPGPRPAATEPLPSRDAPGEGRRYYAMDNLRAWMMLLLIPFHAGIPFITVRAPQYFNDPDAHVFFDGMSLFLLSFRRPLFFVVAGFFAAMLLDRRGLKEMLHNRFQRIVLPLVLGWIVLSPATRAAYKFAAKASSTGSIEQGYDVL